MEGTSVYTPWSTTTTFRSNIRPMPPHMRNSSEPYVPPSAFHRIGVPILTALVVMGIFVTIHVVVCVIPEKKFWERWAKGDDGEDREAFLVKRRNSLQKRLKKFRKSSNKNCENDNDEGGGEHDSPARDGYAVEYEPSTQCSIEDEITSPVSGSCAASSTDNCAADSSLDKTRPVAYVVPQTSPDGTEEGSSYQELQSGRNKSPDVVHVEVHSNKIKEANGGKIRFDPRCTDLLRSRSAQTLVQSNQYTVPPIQDIQVSSVNKGGNCTQLSVRTRSAENMLDGAFHDFKCSSHGHCEGAYSSKAAQIPERSRSLQNLAFGGTQLDRRSIEIDNRPDVLRGQGNDNLAYVKSREDIIECYSTDSQIRLPQSQGMYYYSALRTSEGFTANQGETCI